MAYATAIPVPVPVPVPSVPDDGNNIHGNNSNTNPDSNNHNHNNRNSVSSNTQSTNTRPSLASSNAAFQQDSFRIPALDQSNNNNSGVNSSSYSSMAPPRLDLNESQISALKQQGYTRGLAKAIAASNASFPLRFWIVDNSGSMSSTDGQRMVETKRKNDVKMVQCTRWKEIQETVTYHAQLAALLEAPTVFRLLNDPGRYIGPREFGVANKGNPSTISHDLQVALSTMDNATPSGVTPLTGHILDVKQQIEILLPQLRSEGRRVALVLATDGLPTGNSGISSPMEQQRFVDALRGLEGLPVWIVVRLCTNNDDVVEFYNNLDSQLELSLEVLDDFSSEAEEVYELNPWLNYTLPLHRIREMGFQNRIFDLLDERPLTIGEIREFVLLVFGRESADILPDPAVDMHEFLKVLDKLLTKEEMQWNPIKQKMMPILDLKKLNKSYGNSNCTIM
eukprot:CAMPEP_0184857062 /NCGR_PEP_ID=MMETSP0580-20130426/2233_1 /TAXON_ID=1118495 /ORGANISM="Dactyliosolen fragilissimus" /LENGTH=450 /DNA_ID=CAMNT_0027352439 /DNA_START=180 /DNA_END=1532 /DNA_ORIENTATION=-